MPAAPHYTQSCKVGSLGIHVQRLVCKSEVMMYCTGLLKELLAGAPVHTLEFSARVMKAWMSLATLPDTSVPVSTC